MILRDGSTTWQQSYKGCLTYDLKSMVFVSECQQILSAWVLGGWERVAESLEVTLQYGRPQTDNFHEHEDVVRRRSQVYARLW